MISLKDRDRLVKALKTPSTIRELALKSGVNHRQVFSFIVREEKCGVPVTRKKDKGQRRIKYSAAYPEKGKVEKVRVKKVRVKKVRVEKSGKTRGKALHHCGAPWFVLTPERQGLYILMETGRIRDVEWMGRCRYL
jgi:hypothetical protein